MKCPPVKKLQILVKFVLLLSTPLMIVHPFLLSKILFKNNKWWVPFTNIPRANRKGPILLHIRTHSIRNGRIIPTLVGKGIIKGPNSTHRNRIISLPKDHMVQIHLTLPKTFKGKALINHLGMGSKVTKGMLHGIIQFLLLDQV